MSKAGGGGLSGVRGRGGGGGLGRGGGRGRGRGGAKGCQFLMILFQDMAPNGVR